MSPPISLGVLIKKIEEPPNTVHFHDDITFSDNTPVGGWIDVVISATGDTTCSGHLHDSGFVGYKYTVAAFVVSPSGIAVGGDLLGNQGMVGGTVDTHDRNDDWMKAGYSDRIKAIWDQLQLAQGTFRWQIKVSDNVTPTVVDLFDAMLQSFAQETGKNLADIILPGKK
jgi:hypothetical protein